MGEWKKDCLTDGEWCKGSHRVECSKRSLGLADALMHRLLAPSKQTQLQVRWLKTARSVWWRHCCELSCHRARLAHADSLPTSYAANQVVLFDHYYYY